VEKKKQQQEEATYGAFFCDVEKEIANCFFKNVDGEVIDELTVLSPSEES
jgi:hypothetical protein